MNFLQYNFNKGLLTIILTAILSSFANIGFANDNTYNTKGYIFSQDAIPLEKGEGYYQNTMLLYNSGSYAVINGLNVSGGFIVIPNGVGIFNLNIRYAHTLTNNFHLSGSFNSYLTLDEFTCNPIMKGTFGNRKNNITAGIGINPIKDRVPVGYVIEDAFNLRPNFELSGKVQIRKNISIISENRFNINTYTEKIGTIEKFNKGLASSLGFRIQLKRHIIDLGGATTISMTANETIESITNESINNYNNSISKPLYIPHASYTYMFGKV